MNVAAIMPCRGRAEQTVRNVRRLLSTAGAVEWQLYLVGGADDSAMINDVVRVVEQTVIMATSSAPRLTYWQALVLVTARADAPLLVNLANDLLPGQRWLARAVAAYQATFGDGPGMVGFNDGHHQTEHSPHFLISRSLLDRYGGWPTIYQHNFGDTELVARATQDSLYAKAPWATLYHDHVYFGAGNDDAVYQEGRRDAERDQRVFEWRKAHGWPPYSETLLS